MKTIELKGFVHCKPAESWDDGDLVHNGLKYSFFEYDDMKNCGLALVSPYTITRF